jgi:hypothetical protein
MRRIVQTLAIHFVCIIFFAFFYYYSSVHFDNNKDNKFNYYKSESSLDSIIDFLLFSITIQAGVGISDILPISIYGKLLMMLQQLLMISISVITIYIFTR